MKPNRKSQTRVRNSKTVRKNISKKLYPKRIVTIDKLRAIWYKTRKPLRPNRLKIRGQSIVVEDFRTLKAVALSNIKKILEQKKQIRKKGPIIVTIGGAGGSLKSTLGKALANSKMLKGKALFVSVDSYTKMNERWRYHFQKPPNYKVSVHTIPGQVYNPRAIDFKALIRDLKSLVSGKKTKMRKVPRPFEFELGEVNPKGIEVIIIEGVQASAIPLAKMSDLRIHNYVAPGLQELRTVPRNLTEWPNTEKDPSIRLKAITRNEPGKNYRRAFIDSRIPDADILYVSNPTEIDIRNLPAKGQPKMRKTTGTLLEAIETK